MIILPKRTCQTPGSVSWSEPAENSKVSLRAYRRIARRLRSRLSLSSGLFGGLKRGVIDPQVMLGGLVALAGGAAKPLHGLAHILGHAPPGLVTQAQVALSGRAFL